MKKKIFLIAVLAICLALVATGTLAYFTAEDTAHNVITTGGVNIELVEKTRAEDGALIDFPKEGIKGVMPGTNVSKIVSVKNSGNSDAWIRVKLEQSIKAADGTQLPLELGGKDPVMSFSPAAGWSLGEDGCYYYENAVKAGQSSGILFDTISFTPKMGNEYQGCTANIIISAQAVQTANNGETVMEAKGWPSDT